MTHNATRRTTWHVISDVSPLLRRGVCSRCGPTPVVKRTTRKGVEYWICGTRRADLKTQWNATHTRKHKKSAHFLIESDPVSRRGTCPIDGEVDILPVGRGWGCAVRALELNNARQEEHVRCSMCGKFDSRHNKVSPTGLCEGCERLTQWTKGTTPNAEVAGIKERDLAMMSEHGLHAVSDWHLMNEYAMPEYESAVPGWKTLGV